MACKKKAAACAAPAKLRVAIIGCGGISTTHMAAYKQIPEVEFAAFCDVKQDRLDYYKTTYGDLESCKTAKYYLIDAK